MGFQAYLDGLPPHLAMAFIGMKIGAVLFLLATYRFERVFGTWRTRALAGIALLVIV